MKTQEIAYTCSDMSPYPRIPKNFFFEEGKDYVVKYRRTEHKFLYSFEYEMYFMETSTKSRFNKTHRSGGIIVKDVLTHINYYMGFDEKAKLMLLE